MDNFYENPEKFDLTIIDSIDSGGSYEFNIHVAFKHKDGKVFYSHDAGCSCPTPFDGADMEEVTKECFDSFSSCLTQECKGDFTIGEIRGFLDKIRTELWRK